jgi:hypothetical protein
VGKINGTVFGEIQMVGFCGDNCGPPGNLSPEELSSVHERPYTSELIS